MTLGQRIQELRKRAGLSQEGLGEALGVTRQAVSKWESDNGIPELDTLIAMSRLFGVTIGQLLGVEEPAECRMQEMQNAEAVGLNEERVEAILRRYVEESRQPPRQEKRRWKIPVITAAVLVGLMVFVGAQMGEMKSTIRNLNSRLSYLDSSLSGLSNEIGGMEYRIQDILTEQNNPLSSLDSTVTAFDPEAETVTLRLSGTLKTYTPGTQIQFVLNWTDWETGTGQVVSDWVDGPGFETEVELPMNDDLVGVLRLRDGEGVIQEQTLTEVYPGSLRADRFLLSADSLTELYSIAAGSFATSTAEDPAVRICSPFPNLFQPVSAELTVTLNGEVLDVLPLTLTEEQTGVWYGRSDQEVRTLRLSTGDELVFSLGMIDSLGRKCVQTYIFTAGENGPVETEPEIAVAW